MRMYQAVYVEYAPRNPQDIGIFQGLIYDFEKERHQKRNYLLNTHKKSHSRKNIITIFFKTPIINDVKIRFYFKIVLLRNTVWNIILFLQSKTVILITFYFFIALLQRT